MPTPQSTYPFDPQVYLDWEKNQPEKHEYLDGVVYQVYAMVGARDAHVTVAGNVFALTGQGEGTQGAL